MGADEKGMGIKGIAVLGDSEKREKKNVVQPFVVKAAKQP